MSLILRVLVRDSSVLCTPSLDHTYILQTSQSRLITIIAQHSLCILTRRENVIANSCPSDHIRRASTICPITHNYVFSRPFLRGDSRRRLSSLSSSMCMSHRASERLYRCYRPHNITSTHHAAVRWCSRWQYFRDGVATHRTAIGWSSRCRKSCLSRPPSSGHPSTEAALRTFNSSTIKLSSP